jgi:hypothetical protein
VHNGITRGGGCCQPVDIKNQNTKNQALKWKGPAFKIAGAKPDSFCGLCYNGTVGTAEKTPILEGIIIIRN